MKRMICIILCLCLIASGCGKTPAQENTPQPTDKETVPPTFPQETVTETIPAMAYRNPFTAVSLVPTEHTEQADNTTLYRCSSQNMALVMNDHAVADAIMQDFAQRNSQRLTTIEAALKAASEDYTGQADWNTYFCDTLYDTMRLDQMALSFAATETYFDGTPLSGQNMFSLSYDMQTGIFLSLKDIMMPDYSADVLVDCILEALSDKADILYDDYADSISAMFSTNTPVENWYFTNSGLCFYFNPYEIAPHNKGTILAEIPYAALADTLKDSYFPAETVEFNGSVSMSALDTTDISTTSQFAEAVLDSAGSQYVILPVGTVLNLKVETGTWTKNGTFVSETTVFATEALTEGNALLLQLQPEALGTLCITYQTGSEIVTTPWQAK